MKNIDLLYERNYLIIEKFITPEDCNLLSDGYKEFCARKNVESDVMCENTASYYNYLPFVQLMTESTKTICDYLGEKVMPTFSYARMYKNGSVLEKHKDRPECEIAVSCHLSGDKPWPFYIINPDGGTDWIHMKQGDAVIYLGSKVPHWRDAYDGESYVQAMLFYIKTYGKYSEHYFDKIHQVNRVMYSLFKKNYNHQPYGQDND